MHHCAAIVFLVFLAALGAQGAEQPALAPDDVVALIGEWIIEKDSMRWFSHGLYNLELSRQFNETGACNAAKAFAFASKPTVEGIAQLVGERALDEAGNATGFSFEGVSPDILISSVDPQTGMLAGYWQCNDREAMDGGGPDAPLIHGCVALAGWARKTAAGVELEVTNDSPEVAGRGSLGPEGTLRLRMQNLLEPGKVPDITYLVQASYKKSGKSADEALAYMFASNRGVFSDETQFA